MEVLPPDLSLRSLEKTCCRMLHRLSVLYVLIRLFDIIHSLIKYELFSYFVSY